MKELAVNNDADMENDLVVIADNPGDMVKAQHGLIYWADQKIERCNADVADAEQVLTALEGSELKPDAAKRLLSKARQRAAFYTKVKQALAAGYLIVPDLPSRTVAIRVNRKSPRWRPQTEWPEDSEQKADHLPAGEGRYVAPDPLFDTIERKTGPDDRTITLYRVTGFDEDVVLPVHFMKPAVVERAGKCMQRKIFDEIAVCDNPPAPDPIVLGILNDASRSGHRVCFLIAWFVDTADL